MKRNAFNSPLGLFYTFHRMVVAHHLCIFISGSMVNEDARNNGHVHRILEEMVIFKKELGKYIIKKQLTKVFQEE